MQFCEGFRGGLLFTIFQSFLLSLDWSKRKIQYLVGGLDHFLFSHRLGIIIPTDFHIFQRGRLPPPTTYHFMAILGVWIHDVDTHLSGWSSIHFRWDWCTHYVWILVERGMDGHDPWKSSWVWYIPWNIPYIYIILY